MYAHVNMIHVPEKRAGGHDDCPLHTPDNIVSYPPALTLHLVLCYCFEFPTFKVTLTKR